VEKDIGKKGDWWKKILVESGTGPGEPAGTASVKGLNKDNKLLFISLPG